MPGKGEGRGGEGRKEERRRGRGDKKSKNTPSDNSCLRPCLLKYTLCRDFNFEHTYKFFVCVFVSSTGCFRVLKVILPLWL